MTQTCVGLAVFHRASHTLTFDKALKGSPPFRVPAG